MDVAEANKRGMPWCADCGRTDGSFHVVTSDQFAGKVMLCESCLSRRGIPIPGGAAMSDEPEHKPAMKERERKQENEEDRRHASNPPGGTDAQEKQSEANQEARKERDADE